MIEDKTPHRTSLADLGEFGLIDRLTEGFEIHNPSTLKGELSSLPTCLLKVYISTLAMYR